MLALLLGLIGLVQSTPKPATPVVLVIERSAHGGLTYMCNGHLLDSKRVLTGIRSALAPEQPADTPILVLFGDSVSLDTVFETGSLLVGTAGLRKVRYFTFSRKTGVMMELSPSWDRWKLSFDGTLEKKPW
jgi:hypothetical protein